MANKSMKTLLLVSLLSVSAVLTSCSAVKAQPNNIDSPIVNVKGEDYFRNSIETIYTNLQESGTVNTTVFDELIVNIAKAEVPGKFVSEEKITEICQDILLNEVKGGTYSTDNLFDEEKYVSGLKASNPGISFGKEDETVYNKNYLIMPEDEFEDVLKADYTDYIEKKIRPGVLKSLLTAKYLCENSISSLSRASARNVQYIKLPNFSNKSGAVNNLIKAWLGEYIANPTETIDLDELQTIYKGVEQKEDGLTGKELEKAKRINKYINDYYTLDEVIDEDLDKILEKDDNGYKKVDGKYVMKNSDDTDKTIEDKYTGTGTYTVEWGEELARREQKQKDFTGDDIYLKSKGISDLPAELTDRLFSASVSNYYVQAEVNGEKKGVKFLTPKTILNGDELNKFYSYDSASDSYSIVVINDYYTSSVVNDLIKQGTDKDGNITYADALVDIAYGLSESTTNQRLSLVYYLQKYDIGKNIHDEDFYQYIVDNYVEIVK